MSGRPSTVWTIRAKAPPGSNMSYTASATRASFVQWKDWPKVTSSVRPGCRPGKVLGPGLDPADVRDASFPGGPAALCEHGRVGVEADRLLEQVGEPDGEDAGAAPAVE